MAHPDQSQDRRQPARLRADDEAGDEPDTKPEAEPESEDQGDETPEGGAGAQGKEKKPAKPLYRRVWFWVLIAAVLVGIVAAVVYWWVAVRPYESTDDAFIGADVVDVAPQVAGRVAAVPVETNARVKAGDLLFTIDPASMQAALDSRQAQLAQAQAELLRARSGVVQAKAEAAEAEAQGRSLEVQAQNAGDTLRRDQDLINNEPNAIAEKSVVDATDAARSAEAEAEAGRRRIATADAAVPAAEADVTAAEAAVQAAESQLESARIDLGYATLAAPLAGQVVQKNINLGSYVTPGMAVMAIVPDALYVTANFKETQLDRIRVGQAVALKVDAFPDVDFRGKVVSVQNGAGQAFQILPPQNATGNYVKVVQRVPVRISIDSPDPHDYPLGPGMSVVPRVSVE